MRDIDEPPDDDAKYRTYDFTGNEKLKPIHPICRVDHHYWSKRSFLFEHVFHNARQIGKCCFEHQISDSLDDTKYNISPIRHMGAMHNWYSRHLFGVGNNWNKFRIDFYEIHSSHPRLCFYTNRPPCLYRHICHIQKE